MEAISVPWSRATTTHVAPKGETSREQLSQKKQKNHDTEAAGLGVCFQERLSAEKKNKGVGEEETSPYREILLNRSVVVSSHPKLERLRSPSIDITLTKIYATQLKMVSLSM